MIHTFLRIAVTLKNVSFLIFFVLTGFCTPGIIVSIYTLLANNSSASYMEEHLDGNLCRCTGYRPIWDAARSLCDDGEEIITRGPCGIPCRDCPERDTCEQDCNIQDKTKKNDDLCCSTSLDKMKQYKDTFLKEKESWTQQPTTMFPKVLTDPQSTETLDLTKPLMVVDRSEFHAGGTWFKPVNLEDLLALLSEFGAECKIVVGNTEVGIGKFQLPVISTQKSIFFKKIIASILIFYIFNFPALSCRDKVQACCLSSSNPSF